MITVGTVLGLITFHYKHTNTRSRIPVAMRKRKSFRFSVRAKFRVTNTARKLYRLVKQRPAQTFDTIFIFLFTSADSYKTSTHGRMKLTHTVENPNAIIVRRKSTKCKWFHRCCSFLKFSWSCQTKRP